MSDIDHLFETKPVAELIQLRNENAIKIETSQTELRQLVAEKYRDLLHVADNIIEMNTIVTKSNIQLSQLAFTKSNYSSKYVPNFNNNMNFNRQKRINNVKSSNGDIVLNNLIHEFNYSLLKLKKKGNIFSGSDEVIKLAKHCFLIQLIFKSNINSNPNDFPIIKFKQLKSEFIELIQNQIISIENEFDTDFYLNLLISHILITMKSPLESIIWSFNLRLKHLQLIGSHCSFNKLLTYSFLSFQMVNLSTQKLSVLLSRQISNKSQWLNQTNFKNWINWLDLEDFKLDFPTEMTNPFTIDQSIKSQWEIKIGQLFKLNYDNQLQLDYDKVSTGIKYLTCFKNFSSLTTIKFNESDSIITYILNSLESNLIAFINLQLDHLSLGCENILVKFDDVEYIKSIRTKTGLNLFQDITLNELIDSFNKPDKINEFQTNSDSIIQNIESIKKLSKNIKKPIISIDDFDDEEFWLKISKILIEGVVDQSISQCNKTLKLTFTEFLNDINEKFQNDQNEEIQWLYLIRSLIKFETNFNIREFQTSLGEINSSEFSKININEEVHGCILESFRKIFDSLFDKFNDRIIQGCKLEPNIFGISIEGVILEMVSSLRMPLDKEDFSDVFESQISIDIQDEFLSKLSRGIKESLDDNANEDNGITNYINCVFIESMMSNGGTSVESDKIIENLKSNQKEFEDEQKLKMIRKTVVDHYNSEKIILFPFC